MFLAEFTKGRIQIDIEVARNRLNPAKVKGLALIPALDRALIQAFTGIGDDL